MSVTSMQAQIDSLLRKGVVLPKVGGAPSPDVETASVLESLALALMLQPKAAFYAHYLAKNGLVTAIGKEISAIEVLKQTVTDLANTTYAIKDTKDLARAQAALLQLSTQGQMSSKSSAFDRYNVAVNDFLNKQLGKNIKRPGATEMVRPGEEAGLSLPDDLSSLKDLHTDLLDRLYAMAVGISNFVNTPFSSIVGANAVYRAKRDLDSLLAEVQADESGSQSRDAAIRLIAGRATVQMVGAPVELTAPTISTAQHLPPDQLLSGKSLPTPAVATTAVGPFVMALAGSLSMTVNGQVVSTAALNQASNKAAVLGEAVTYPVSVPANYHLFLRLEAVSGLSWTFINSPAGPTDQGSYSEPTLGSGWFLSEGVYFKLFKVVLNSGSAVTSPPGSASPIARTLTDVLSYITTTLGALGTALEFVTGGSNRVLIIATEPKVAKIAIVTSMSVMEDQSAGYVTSPGATVYYLRSYTNSFNEELGFQANQVGVAGNTPTSRILAGLQLVFSSLVTFLLNADNTITMTTLATIPGTSMLLSGTWVGSLGLAASYFAASEFSTLQGVDGVVSPIDQLDIGDLFEASTGQAQVSDLHGTFLTLSSQLRTFESDITVTSAMYLVWKEIDNQVRSFLNSWVEGPFASGLDTLDRLIAVLIGSPSSPRRSEAITLLDDLKTQLLGLQTSVTSVAATLLPGSATKEKAAINNAIATFEERKLDRALDFLLRCKLQEIFELDWQSASYSGNLMKAASSVATRDIKFPNTTNDEGFDVAGLRNGVR